VIKKVTGKATHKKDIAPDINKAIKKAKTLF